MQNTMVAVSMYAVGKMDIKVLGVGWYMKEINCIFPALGRGGG